MFLMEFEVKDVLFVELCCICVSFIRIQLIGCNGGTKSFGRKLVK